ncbi:DUF4134 domain-containing protein [Hymenobacter sp. GOD-10R]|uniref:DUF4134 domain-containing protein n=1 Tax=Hymenobacter sp. GOD-10R TaxID=3093922 RepID=UPI002D7A1A7A|nr:DUF4134 domain-containing protein [Hymenobacter sp. GOD-10R]WRQ31616.1 DUF4134 domain-containing protein [Hymenobacter sp. GOD-10R]
MLATALVVLTTATAALAQGDGSAGITKATSMIGGYFDNLTLLMYAIGAAAGLGGAITAFIKWNSGDQNTQKHLTAWFGSCIFLVVSATILRSFFL